MYALNRMYRVYLFISQQRGMFHVHYGKCYVIVVQNNVCMNGSEIQQTAKFAI